MRARVRRGSPNADSVPDRIRRSATREARGTDDDHEPRKQEPLDPMVLGDVAKDSLGVDLHGERLVVPQPSVPDGHAQPRPTAASLGPPPLEPRSSAPPLELCVPRLPARSRDHYRRPHDANILGGPWACHFVLALARGLRRRRLPHSGAARRDRTRGEGARGLANVRNLRARHRHQPEHRHGRRRLDGADRPGGHWLRAGDELRARRPRRPPRLPRVRLSRDEHPPPSEPVRARRAAVDRGDQPGPIRHRERQRGAPRAAASR